MDSQLERIPPAAPLARSLNDAAVILGGVHPRLFLRLERDGLLRLIRIGDRTLIPQSEIDRLLAGEPVTAQAREAV
jgi:hypothetical protein